MTRGAAYSILLPTFFGGFYGVCVQDWAYCGIAFASLMAFIYFAKVDKPKQPVRRGTRLA